MGRYNRYRRYRGAGMGFSVFIIIIVLAVTAGYAGTKYVIYPYLLNGSARTEDASEKQDAGATTTSGIGVDTIASMPSVIIDKQDIKDAQDTKLNTNDQKNENKSNSTSTSSQVPSSVNSAGPYCVQFGNFSTKEGAEILSNSLKANGIYSFTYENNGTLKVLGQPYTSQEKAKQAAAIVSAVAEDAFVVDLSTIIQ